MPITSLLLISLWKRIEYWDQTFFLTINRDGSNSFFDTVMPWVREPNFWAPLYIFLIAFAAYNFKWKGWMWILMAIATVSFSDTVSSHWLKNWFERLRPCQDPFFSRYIAFRVSYCPSSFSFTSSHAANHFAMATYIYTTTKTMFGKWMQLFFVWAFIVSYAQIYVGVHYPLDVMGGTLVGFGIGYISGKIFNHYFSLTATSNIATDFTQM